MARQHIMAGSCVRQSHSPHGQYEKERKEKGEGPTVSFRGRPLKTLPTRLYCAKVLLPNNTKVGTKPLIHEPNPNCSM
jgi:hypothetical protein